MIANAELTKTLEELTEQSAFLTYATSKLLDDLPDAIPNRNITAGAKVSLYEFQDRLNELLRRCSGNDG